MDNYFSFIGGNDGAWQVTSNRTIIGEPLESVQRIDVINLPASELKVISVWVLQGFTSNLRYTLRTEVTQLRAKQESLNRPNCMCAAMIPIKKMRNGGLWRKMKEGLFLKNNRTTLKLVLATFLKLLVSFTTHAT